MPYEIIIKSQQTKTKIVGKEWTVVGHKDDEQGKPVYGYTPQIEKTVVETEEIYRQMVETIDLEKVIKAVNNID